MSNPVENTDTQEDVDANKAEPTFADRVSDAIKNMVQDDKGVWQLPEELPEEVRVAAVAEKRYRDTQSAFTKISQEKKALEAEKSVLLQKALQNVTIELTEEQKEELEDLKFSDPEAWRKKMNVYEQDALRKHKAKLDEDVKVGSASSLETEELERRKAVLSDFLTAHPGFDINDDVIANDIPPRITKKLANGEISFEDFLQECYDYTKTGKVVHDTKAYTHTDMSKMGGGASPDPNAVKEDIVRSYNKETY